MSEKISVLINSNSPKVKSILSAFAEGFKAKKVNSVKKTGNIVGINGFLYGQEKLVSSSKEYFHIDNGYFCRSKPPSSLKGYYRIVHNNIYFDSSNIPQEEKVCWERFKKLGLKLCKWRNNGSDVVVVPPSKYTVGILKLNNWLNETVEKLGRYTDRPIHVSTKKNPVKWNDVWCVVTAISNIQVEALLRGIPVITTHCTKIGRLEDIERPPMNRDILSYMSNQQWTLQEIKSGKAKREVYV